MNQTAILERIRKWQEEPVFHELTCGKDSRHEVLKAKVQDGVITLFCPNCDYTQKEIPEMFYYDSFDEMYEQQRKVLKGLTSEQDLTKKL